MAAGACDHRRTQELMARGGASSFSRFHSNAPPLLIIIIRLFRQTQSSTQTYKTWQVYFSVPFNERPLPNSPRPIFPLPRLGS